MISKNKERVNITLNKDVMKWIDDATSFYKAFDKSMNRSKLIELIIKGFIMSDNPKSVNKLKEMNKEE